MFTVMAWCRTRSRMAVAMMRSPNTSPQLAKLWLLVIMWNHGVKLLVIDEVG